MKVIDGGTEELVGNNSGAHSMSRLGRDIRQSEILQF